MERQVGTQAGDDAQTSGTQVRPPRDLAEPVVIDLGSEASTLFDEPQWAQGDRNSRTVSTTERMRVTLIALRSGAELGQGQLAVVAQPGGWRLTAAEDALLLLTVALDRSPTATDLDDA